MSKYVFTGLFLIFLVFPAGRAAALERAQVPEKYKWNTATPAQLHFIQRFGGALNLHIHVHAVVSDGVYELKKNALGRPVLAFTPVPPPGRLFLKLPATGRAKPRTRWTRKATAPASATTPTARP